MGRTVALSPEARLPCSCGVWGVGLGLRGMGAPGGGGRLSTTHAVNPLTMWAYLRIIRSSQPQRRFLPVVTPHSWPRLCSRSPISCGPLTTTPPHARPTLLRPPDDHPSSRPLAAPGPGHACPS